MATFWKFLGGVAIAIGALAGALTIKSFLFAGPPKFSGSLSDQGGAASAIAFLGKHNTGKVSLNTTCIANPGSACAISGGPGNSTVVTLDSGSGHSETAELMFSTSPGASGTLTSPGAGYLTISGTWAVQDLGSGGSTPEGVPDYQLTGTS
jgi:hypothetical protein